MNEQPLLPQVPSDPQRSQRLTVLCILTFIWSGLNTFSYLFMSMFFKQIMLVAEEVMEKFNLPEMELLLNAPQGFFLITGLLFAGSVTGSVYMWQLRKTGFHIYTISQILILIAQMYFLKLSGPSLPEFIITGIFIILYSTQLKLMR